MEDFEMIQYPRYWLDVSKESAISSSSSSSSTQQPAEQYNVSTTTSYPLYETPYCFTCHDHQSTLLRCTGCKLAYYCSQTCQEIQLNEHNSQLCQCFQSELDDVQNEQGSFQLKISTLRRTVWTRDFRIRRSMIATCIIILYKKLSIANRVYDNIAWKYDTAQAWEFVWQQYAEMQKLTCWDVLDTVEEEDDDGVAFIQLKRFKCALQLRYPFILLYLNRDDEASWYLLDQDMRDQIPLAHKKDCRYHDFLTVFDDGGALLCRYPQVILAMAIIKLRLVVNYNSVKKPLDEFFKTFYGSKLIPVQSIITAMVFGHEALQVKMASQQAQLDGILNQIDRWNPTTLPALLNPEPLLRKRDPKRILEGDASESFYIVKLAYRLWHQIPQASELLTSRYGANPAYDTYIEYNA